MSRTLTQDGDTVTVYGALVTFMFSGAIGGGTLSLKRLKDGGDESNAADWVTIQDNDNVADYTTSPAGNHFDLGGAVKVKGTLSGSTSPNIEYHLAARQYFGHE